jgi:hypothetical protein
VNTCVVDDLLEVDVEIAVEKDEREKGTPRHDQPAAAPQVSVIVLFYQ